MDDLLYTRNGVEDGYAGRMFATIGTLTGVSAS